MSIVYRERERERERDWDDRKSSYGDNPRGSYTTVKKYRIPREEETDRISIHERDRHSSDRGGGGFEETRIIRREREREPEPPRVERDVRIERVTSEREVEPPRERIYRYERDFDRLPPPRREPYDLERYSRSVDYFPRPEPPQPIIIRQEPQQIIIQEAPRAPIVIPRERDEGEFQIVQRSEVGEDRQIARREPPREEDYYYERRTREVKGGSPDRDRGGRGEHFDEEHRHRREVSPHDSISQHGRDRDYSSDDSMVYVRREREGGRDMSPHHRRHLAEGAIAGLGAAELLRNHHKREGNEVSGPVGRVGKDLGAAALGAVGAQAIARARSRHRSRSRYDGSPERDGYRDGGYDDRRDDRRDDREDRRDDREGRRKHRKHRSRSRSKSRVKQLATLGVGAAAIAAAVGYARHRNKPDVKEDRRSRSRTRRASVGDVTEVTENDSRNPGHSRKRVAQAGLAGAALAGLVERARSKSRNGKDKKGGKSRSRSRLRTGLPIAAAGLGSAAIAGLYERNQANKKETEARREARRKSRSRSRSRSRSVPYDGPPVASASDPGLIEYGDQPIYSAGGVPDYYNRSANQAGYYGGPQDAMVPAAAASGAAYGAARERSRDRRRSSSSDSSGSGRKRRHRRKKSGSRSQSRSRELATAAAAAGAAGLAASEYSKRKERKRAEKERRRYEAENPQYQEPYSPHAYSPMSPPPNGQPAPYGQDNYYPSTNSFPPPPNANAPANYNPNQPYNPADYPPPNPQLHPEYGYSPQVGYTPPQGVYSPPPQEPYGAGTQPAGAARRADENVSAEPSLNTTNTNSKYAPHYTEQHIAEEGVNSASSPPSTTPAGLKTQQRRPRATSQPPPHNKSVQFAGLDPSVPNTPARIRNRRRGDERDYDSDDSHGSFADHRDGRQRPRDHGKRRQGYHSDNDSRSPSPTGSEGTIDLPERFDEHGRPKGRGSGSAKDPLQEKIEDLLSGKGSAGKLIRSLTDGLLGGGDGDSDKRDRGGRRRSRRYS